MTAEQYNSDQWQVLARWLMHASSTTTAIASLNFHCRQRNPVHDAASPSPLLPSQPPLLPAAATYRRNVGKWRLIYRPGNILTLDRARLLVSLNHQSFAVIMWTAVSPAKLPFFVALEKFISPNAQLQWRRGQDIFSSVTVD